MLLVPCVRIPTPANNRLDLRSMKRLLLLFAELIFFGVFVLCLFACFLPGEVPMSERLELLDAIKQADSLQLLLLIKHCITD